MKKNWGKKKKIAFHFLDRARYSELTHQDTDEPKFVAAVK